MATEVDFLVTPENEPIEFSPEQIGVGYHAIPRYSSSGAIALNGRTQAFLPGTVTPVPMFFVTVTLTPQQLDEGATTSVHILVQEQIGITTPNNKVPAAGRNVYMSSNQENVAPVPDSYLVTGSNGTTGFTIITASVGEAIITATILVDGHEITGSATLFVGAHEFTENYDATGYGRVVLTVENQLANALFPRVQRLSHEEQKKVAEKLGYVDTGLSRASGYFGSTEIIFVPKFLQSR